MELNVKCCKQSPREKIKSILMELGELWRLVSMSPPLYFVVVFQLNLHLSLNLLPVQSVGLLKQSNVKRWIVNVTSI